ncbi:MAG: hypothetical protein CO128_02085 [Ignavibacteriales bacterium CG_4_9_14_3_um_filter_30_11]|nr:MAG: hypothetical protein CO128_02085 [Ignavibacteriales bacterium CG_4_9_14_3_um_filter_30_11]
MNLILDVSLIIFLYILFGLSHSFLSSKKVKELVVEKFGNLIAFYRLFYNILSVLFLLIIFEIAPHPDVTIYDLKSPYDFIILIPQFLGLIGFFWCFNYLCVSEVIGLAQIKRWLNNEYEEDELDEKTTLNINGPYKFIRHPIYFFSIIFLIARPTMDLFYLISIICAMVYFYIGSIYEEKKLVERYGELYIQYQSFVPRILPLKIFKPYKVDKNI